jgi:hypothetical protein
MPMLETDFLLGWFSILNMDVIHFSKTSVHVQPTRSFIPEDDNLHNYRSENLLSHEHHTALLYSSYYCSGRESIAS